MKFLKKFNELIVSKIDTEFNLNQDKLNILDDLQDYFLELSTFLMKYKRARVNNTIETNKNAIGSIVK